MRCLCLELPTVCGKGAKAGALEADLEQQGRLDRAHSSSAQGGLQWAVGGAGEELVSCPALCQGLSESTLLCPFNLCSCLPRLCSGWCSPLHLALLGRLQKEVEAVASSTLVFPVITARKSLAHTGRRAKRRMLGRGKWGALPPLRSELLLMGLHRANLSSLPPLLVVLAF